jgi:hypothetical protein
MLADELDFVVGVDSHRDWHTLAVVEVRNGVVVHEARARATGVVTQKRCASQSSMLWGAARSRLRARAPTVPG